MIKALQRFCCKWTVCPVFCILLAFGAAGAQAQTAVYVDNDALPGGDGTTWATAFNGLQDALTEASTNGLITEVRVAAGTYRPAGPGGDRDSAFQLVHGLAIRGGYAGFGAPDPDLRDVGGHPTILSGDLNGDDGPGFVGNDENSYHVVTDRGAGAAAILDGFRITGGNANGSAVEEKNRGGGIYIDDSSPTVRNCVISGNSATGTGGGMYTKASTLTVVECVFSENSASEGGGMYNQYSSPTVTNCTFARNTSVNTGGGIYSSHWSSPTLSSCLIIGNTAANGGGGMKANYHSTPTLNSCAFSGNSATEGGALVNDGSTVTVVNCTFSGNSAASFGGAVHNRASGDSVLANCILWGNTAATGSQIYSDTGSTATASYSCVQGGWYGDGNINADPLFVDADGPDDTAGTEDDDVHLQGDSPCVNAGDNSQVPGEAKDYEGDDRIQHCLVDMGADETSHAVPDCNSNGVPDVCDIVHGPSIDCNANGVPDECDISSGTSEDTNTNGVPDECQPIHNLTQGTYYVGIQTAINDAVDYDEIRVGPGTYVERINLLGKTITLRSTDGPGATIIDGRTCGLPGDAGGSVLICSSGEGPGTMIDGFRITGGNANGSAVEEKNRGGGIYIDDSSPTVRNCVISGNSATGTGGGMYTKASTLTVVECVFSENSASEGGGMYNQYSSPTVTNCTFARNTSVNTGGGIYSSHWSSPTLSSCLIIGNTAANGGGGMKANYHSTPTLNSCAFSGNSATEGGALVNDGSTVTVVNCTFSGNSAASFGGAVHNRASGDSVLANCILWGNTAATGSQIYSDTGSTATASYSCVQGGWYGTSNIDEDPLLTPDGHLRVGSSCIDAGSNGLLPADELDLNTNGNVTEPIPFDLDWESRVIDGTVDMGADEFVDSDGDGLPDAYELEYFGSAMAADPGADVDTDGISTLAEYEVYGSNPIAQPHYVSPSGNDAWTGLAAVCDPITSNGPKQTIQAALDVADDGDTVLVLPGTYTGSSNRNLNFGRRSIVLQSTDGPSLTSIETADGEPVVNESSVRGTYGSIEGFSINNLGVDPGVGLGLTATPFQVLSCELSNTIAANAGPLFVDAATPTLSDFTLWSQSGSTGTIKHSNINLTGAFALDSGPFNVFSSWFDGPGYLELADDVTLNIVGESAGNPATVFRTDIRGLGDIHIDLSQTLRIEDGAVVDLSGDVNTDGCADQGASRGWGSITIEGSLLVQDASIRNTNVDVRLADFEGSTDIINNDITLLEASTGFGGQFFVEGGSTIECNIIVSEGDRYLDLDPDPNIPPGERPVVQNNRFHVKIKQGANNTKGTLLELRTQDYDCPSIDCPSGAIELPSSVGYSDTWTLEQLDILPGAKLSLTNRQGFEYDAGTSGLLEAVYVKDLVLYPDAVLNTALQRLYYQKLTYVDTNGSPVSTNGSEIVDVPLLGFSLGIIAMEDDEEFDIRVRRREWDPVQPCECTGICTNGAPADPSACLVGSITREEGILPPASTNGVMRMKTKAVGRDSATSVSAKGAFARAGDEDILVAFEYKFVQDPGADAELVVYLSDQPDVGDNLVEVARVYPPASGRAGALDSDELAMFNATFPRGDLNFVRGTYVELELRGTDVEVLIDNFDPQVRCFTYVCGDLSGDYGISSADFLYVLGEYGQVLNPTGSNKWCLDNELNSDGYVDIGDVLDWDAYLNNPAVLNLCGDGTPAGRSAKSAKSRSSVIVPPDALVIAGKPRGFDPYGLGLQDDWLYFVDDSQSCPSPAEEPASVPGPHGHRANRRLVRDSSGEVYQIHGLQGLVRLSDAADLIPFGERTFNGDTVHVGMTSSSGSPLGAPLSDVAFHPVDSTVVYVVPVLVSPLGESTYRAAARLRLQEGNPTEPYVVEQVYGVSPLDAAVQDCVNAYPPEASECDLWHQREIEVDGDAVFVISAQGSNANDWLLVYDEANPDPAEDLRVLLTDLHASLLAPTSLALSASGDALYLASSVNTPYATSTQVFELSIQRSGQTVTDVTAGGTIDIENMRHVTSIAEHPRCGTLWILGFLAPTYGEYATFDEFDELFSWPTLAEVAVDTSTAVAVDLTCNNLALPISAVFGVVDEPSYDADEDTDVDLADFAALQVCFTGDSGTATSNCQAVFDSDCDDDVDLEDFEEFNERLQGP